MYSAKNYEHETVFGFYLVKSTLTYSLCIMFYMYCMYENSLSIKRIYVKRIYSSSIECVV